MLDFLGNAVLLTTVFAAGTFATIKVWDHLSGSR